MTQDHHSRIDWYPLEANQRKEYVHRIDRQSFQRSDSALNINLW